MFLILILTYLLFIMPIYFFIITFLTVLVDYEFVLLFIMSFICISEFTFFNIVIYLY